MLCRAEASTQEDNPFMEMCGKKYSEYSLLLQEQYNRLYDLDSVGRWKQVEQFREAVAACGSKELGICADMFEYSARFCDSRKSGLVPSAYYTAEDFISDILPLANKTKEAGFREINVDIMFAAAETYQVYLKGWESAFEYCRLAKGELDELDVVDYPMKYHQLLIMGNLYLYFQDYEGALAIYSKITGGEAAGWKYWYPVKGALNGMGICYASLGDYELSDSVYRAILDMPRAEEEPADFFTNFRALGFGGLGNNESTRGNYRKAIPLLKQSLDIMFGYGDWVYCRGKAISLAESYLYLNELDKTGEYLALAQDFAVRRLTGKEGLNDHSKEYYRVASKYYSFVHKPEQAAAYVDSMLAAERKHNDDFSGLVLRRVEQKLHQVEIDLQKEELKVERILRSSFQRIAALTTAAFVIMGVLLLFYLRLYRRKRAAYEELAHKAEEWASDKSDTSALGKRSEVTKEDRELFERIHHTMIDKKLFKESTLTLDALAQTMGVSRNAVSKAINSVAGVNLNNFVNNYRIKEAVRILSSQHKRDIYMEELSEQVGFASRATFYAAFKKITGLTPAEYRMAKKPLL